MSKLIGLIIILSVFFFASSLPLKPGKINDRKLFDNANIKCKAYRIDLKSSEFYFSCMYSTYT